MTPIEGLRTGTPVTIQLLSQLGFAPHSLQFLAVVDDEPHCEWNTEGVVPNAPGVYAFVLTHPEWQGPRVTYVGMTTHLWMVTKGRLPRGGGARPANRYGRHKYAGSTRVRVNGYVASARRAGCTVSHWLSPRPGFNESELKRLEGDLIAGWRLRETGWNVG
ncbi:MAG TPA: hypothetical protein PLB21_08340 [Actinomycetota bacterium]|nr:hypothetical protein [Actinomycetota bacterium]